MHIFCFKYIDVFFPENLNSKIEMSLVIHDFKGEFIGSTKKKLDSIIININSVEIVNFKMEKFVSNVHLKIALQQ